MAESSPSKRVCVFCGGDATQAVSLDRFGAHSCGECVGRLGKLVGAGAPSLLELWPMLADDESEALEPEPKVRRNDGSSVELREVTAELKRELTPDKRVQLAVTYGGLSMWREQILECAQVLQSDAPQEVVQQATDLLFSRALYRSRDLETLRGRLYPA
ncbi:MAG: hypothetical protein M3Y59_13885 [Myxococcota bacterium]|nr:hypothetical protein [Myxococcota bacterium]